MELASGYPQMESSDFYSNTIVIPDLKMVWNDNLHAFVSVGKIGLGNFGNHIVNKYVDGCVMFDRRLGNITYYFQNDMFQTYINYMQVTDSSKCIAPSPTSTNDWLIRKRRAVRVLRMTNNSNMLRCRMSRCSTF
jgi:hypothetical protein